MNLSQLIERVQKSAQHTPAPSEGYTSFLKDIINEAYYDIWSQMAYDFNIKEEFIRVWPDYIPSDLNGAYITFNQGSDVAVFETAPFGSSDPYREQKLVGAYILANGLYYRIENVWDDTNIKLDRPWEQSSVGEYTDYKIIHRYVNLPADLIDLHGIEWSDFPVAGETVGKSYPVTRRMQTHMALDSDISGNRPRDYVVYERDYAPTQPTPLAVRVETLGGATTDISSTTHYIGYTVVNSDGAESGMSDLLAYEAAATLSSFTIGFNKVTYFDAADPQTTNRYNIYYAFKRPNTEGFKFYKLGTIGGMDGEYEVTMDATTLTNIKQGGVSEVYDPNAGTKKIRFFPRPTAQHMVDGNVNVSGFLCRYMFQPPRLVSDYDTPIIPAMFHHLIVSRALVELHGRNGQFAASNYELNKLTDGMKRLRASHGSTSDAIPVRGKSMGIHGRATGYGRMLNVSYTAFNNG